MIFSNLRALSLSLFADLQRKHIFFLDKWNDVCVPLTSRSHFLPSFSLSLSRRSLEWSMTSVPSTSSTFSNWPRFAILHSRGEEDRGGKGETEGNGRERSPCLKAAGCDFWNFKSGFALQMWRARAMSRSRSIMFSSQLSLN